MSKYLYQIIFCFIFISGCVASKPMVHDEEGVIWNNYSLIEIQPVEDETGEKYEFDVTSHLGSLISSKLKLKGYQVTNNTPQTEKVLILKSRLISYVPGNALKRWAIPGGGASQATVLSSLIDKETGKINSEMATSESIGGGFLGGIGGDKKILEMVADGIANEIDQRIKE